MGYWRSRVDHIPLNAYQDEQLPDLLLQWRAVKEHQQTLEARVVRAPSGIPPCPRQRGARSCCVVAEQLHGDDARGLLRAGVVKAQLLQDVGRAWHAEQRGGVPGGMQEEQ